MLTESTSRRLFLDDHHRPRGPKPTPVVGHVPHLVRGGLPYLQHLRDEYGDVVSLRIVRWVDYLVSHPDDIQAILVKHHRDTTKDTLLRSMHRVFGKGLLTSDGSHWRKQRKIMAPAFKHDSIGRYAEWMLEITERTAGQWQPGQEIDLSDALSELTLRIVARTLFSLDSDVQAAQMRQILTSIGKVFNLKLALAAMIPDYFPSPTTFRYLKSVSRLNHFVFNVIAARKRFVPAHGDLLDALLDARDDDGQPMSDQQLRDECVTLILAGHETTANLLTWTFAMLDQAPSWQAKLRAEVEHVTGGGALRPEHFGSLVLTRQVLNETLRLFPPAPRIARELTEPIDLEGVRLAPNSGVIISPYVVHRDSRWYSDPDVFRPERWTPQFEKSLPKGAFIPFGGGPRVCIGDHFAKMEAALILASLIRRFDFRATTAVDDRDADVSIVMRPAHGLSVTLSEPNRTPKLPAESR